METGSKTFCATVALGLTLASQASALDWKVKRDWYGCQSREYFDKLVSYAVAKDTEAFKKALAAGVMTGECTFFTAGESVFVADTAIFSGMTKLRRKGEIAEYWTNIETAEPAK